MNSLRPITRRLCVWAMAASVLSSSLGLPLSGCANRSPIRIGFAGELTGRQADLGVHGRNGAQLAVETINAAGGVAGRPIELVVRDDRGTPEGAQTADRELMGKGVVAIIGHMTSAQTVAGRSATEPAKMVLFSPAASTPELSGLDDFFFRITPTHLDQANILAQHVYHKRGLARIAVIYDTDNAAYAESYADAFAKSLESMGGQVVARISFASSRDPNLASLVTELRIANPAGLLIIASPLDTALLAQHTRLSGWNVPLFSSAWAQTEGLIQNGGQAVEGIEIMIAFDVNSQSAAYQKFKTRYQASFGHAPTFAAGEAYEVVLVLAAALGKTGGRAEGLPQALLKTHDFEGLIGKISLDAYGDVARTLFLVSIRNGEFVTLAAVEPK